MKKQRVILETNEGSCRNEKMLKEVWEERLRQIAPHYKIKSVKILKRKTELICECGHKQWEEHKSSFYKKNKDLKMVAQECNVKGCKCEKFRRRKVQ